MNLAQENEKGIQVLLSMGLFQDEEEATSYITNYAFKIDTYPEESFELGQEVMNYLNKTSEKSGISIPFLMNAILKRYLKLQNEK